MKRLMLKSAAILAALVFSAGISVAAEPSAPAKQAKDSAKATAAKASDVKKESTAGTAKTVSEAKTDAKAAASSLIDINSATEAELKSIPGIGDAYASKIIVNRPYAKKDQLKSRNILPAQVYDSVKDRIIAKQPKKDVKPTMK